MPGYVSNDQLYGRVLAEACRLAKLLPHILSVISIVIGLVKLPFNSLEITNATPEMRALSPW